MQSASRASSGGTRPHERTRRAYGPAGGTHRRQTSRDHGTCRSRRRPTTAPSSKQYQPATPEPGTDIPAQNVNFGMRPYADNTYFVVGIQKGFFKDVGINIQPEPNGLKTTEQQWG